jgi:hypothetical protein
MPFGVRREPCEEAKGSTETDPGAAALGGRFTVNWKLEMEEEGGA